MWLHIMFKELLNIIFSRSSMNIQYIVFDSPVMNSLMNWWEEYPCIYPFSHPSWIKPLPYASSEVLNNEETDKLDTIPRLKGLYSGWGNQPSQQSHAAAKLSLECWRVGLIMSKRPWKVVDDINQSIFLGGGDSCAVYNGISIHLAGRWIGRESLHMDSTY